MAAAHSDGGQDAKGSLVVVNGSPPERLPLSTRAELIHEPKFEQTGGERT
jgi:hypothetical protein